MARYMSKDFYKNVLTDGDEDTDGSRLQFMKGLIGAYRQYALDEVGKEIPELKKALYEGKVNAARALVQQRARQPET